MATVELQPTTTAGLVSRAEADLPALLRFSTAGSVDDGKSTLIGRLLYDSRSLYEDVVASVAGSRINRAETGIDLSLFTDGLRAEREQGITIDVAYRYFSTAKRKFIIADTPGHEEYTRNMATGASTANATIVLLDASKGVLPQSRRHAYIARLLGVEHVIGVVNKMDLVGYSEPVFNSIAAEFRALTQHLGLRNVHIIPVSALRGDNVVTQSGQMPWYQGAPLLQYLEELPISTAAEQSLRFPVQYVLRPDASFRGYAGQILTGSIRKGQPIVVLPSRRATHVKSIVTFDGERDEALAGDAVTLTLADEVDVSRGDLIVADDGAPRSSRRVRAELLWLHSEPSSPSRTYLLKHTTRLLRARITAILHRVDIATLAQTPAGSLALNDIGEVEIDATSPLFFDPYKHVRQTGSFILIDPLNNATVAAGMIQSSVEDGAHLGPRAGAQAAITPDQRAARFGHSAGFAWVSDPALADAYESHLFADHWNVVRVDAEDLGEEQLEAVAQVLARTGAVTLFTSAATKPAPSWLREAFGEALLHTSSDDSTGSAWQRFNDWRARLQVK